MNETITKLYEVKMRANKVFVNNEEVGEIVARKTYDNQKELFYFETQDDDPVYENLAESCVYGSAKEAVKGIERDIHEAQAAHHAYMADCDDGGCFTDI